MVKMEKVRKWPCKDQKDWGSREDWMVSWPEQICKEHFGFLLTKCHGCWDSWITIWDGHKCPWWEVTDFAKAWI